MSVPQKPYSPAVTHCQPPVHPCSKWLKRCQATDRDRKKKTRTAAWCGGSAAMHGRITGKDVGRRERHRSDNNHVPYGTSLRRHQRSRKENAQETEKGRESWGHCSGVCEGLGRWCCVRRDSGCERAVGGKDRIYNRMRSLWRLAHASLVESLC